MAKRRKYRFANRAEAEAAYQKADRQRLLTEWLFTAVAQKRHVIVGRTKGLTIGYVTVRHSAFVFALRRDKSSLNIVDQVCDLADCNDLRALVRSYHASCQGELRQIGQLYETAIRELTEALKAA